MNIRDANPSDAEDIAKIQVDVWKQAYKNIFPEEFLQQRSYEEKTHSTQNWLENLEETTRVFIAEVKSKEIVGFTAGGLERENHPIYKGELWGIYVLKEYQRSGIGTSLVKNVVHHLLDCKINSMLVWVLKDNPYRIFYEKLKGIFLQEKQKDFQGLIRPLVAYGWLNIRKTFDNL